MLQRLPSGHYFGASRELVRGAGLLLESTVFEPGLVIPRHEHEHGFFCLVTAGQASRQWPGRRGADAPMHLTMFPAEQPHQNLWGDDGGEALHIEFSAGWMQRAGAAAGVLAQAADFDRGLPLALARRLAGECRMPDDVTPLAVEGLVLELLAACRRDDAAPPHAVPSWLRRAAERLADDWRTPPALAELAREAGVSPDHLSRRFRAAFGLRPGDFLRRRRIDEALRLMHETADSLADIALACGFADQSHFGRVFKRLHGVSPDRFLADALSRTRRNHSRR
jgi:AraC family transcriptional regulator